MLIRGLIVCFIVVLTILCVFLLISMSGSTAHYDVRHAFVSQRIHHKVPVQSHCIQARLGEQLGTQTLESSEIWEK